MKHLLPILLSLALLTSCALTKEERRVNRATKKLERLVTKYPELKRTDTIETVRTIVMPKVQVDTVHAFSTDTVEITRDNLRVRYVTDTITNTIWLNSVCDTIVVTDTVKTPCPTTQPIKYVETAKCKEKVQSWWRTVAIVFICISVVLGLGLVVRFRW